MSTNIDEGNVLTSPLCIGDLIKNGTQFEINTNFNDNLRNELFDDLNIDDDDDDDEENDSGQNIISPWDKSFAELRETMTKINENLYKKIVHAGNAKSLLVPERCKVEIRYNAYWEGEKTPFDSSIMRGDSLIFHCGQREVLEGLELAVRTMRKNEESQFLISYNLLFKEMGCPPRIKPKADGLFIIRLIDYIEVGDANAIEDVSDENRNKFPEVLKKVKEVHQNGKFCFQQGKTSTACKSFHRAVSALEYCNLSNEEEQEEQKKFLVTLYTNLALCYNRLNSPGKACLMCNEIRRISNINENCKALFLEGRALLMLGDYGRAKTRLVQAQKLQPNNPEISTELKLLTKKYEEYNKVQKNIWKKAFGIIEEAKKEDTKENNKNRDDNNKFKTEMYKLLKDYSEKEDIGNFVVPEGLSNEELENIKESVKELGLKFQTKAGSGEQIFYTISK